MGILKKTRVDSVFGEIRFRRTFGLIGSGFWEGKVFFPPVKKQVQLQVASGASGPTSEQGAHYRQIALRYESLLAEIKNVIVDTPLKYFGPDFFGKLMPELSWKDFELDAIGIGKSSTPEQEWNLSYRYLPMTETYSVSFKGWTPVDSALDD